MAELLARDGTVERSTAAAVTTWETAPVGQRFELGDAVRTGDASTAQLRVGARGGVRMQPRTVLRFLGERPEAPSAVRLETGEVELDSADELVFETERGSVTLQAGARVRARTGDSARVEVIAGRVVFEEDGVARTAEAGDAVVLAVGRVVFEDDASFGAPPEPVEPTPTEAVAAEDPVEETGEVEEDALAEDDAAEASDPSTPGVQVTPSPERAHVSIPAGESPVIHDASAPTAVRIDFGAACPGRAIVTIRAGRRPVRYAGEGSAVVTIPTGRARYAIDCVEGSDPRGGTITVRRDDGSSRLDPVPPRNVVDTDGRTYDVLYQNALPILTVRWRESGSGNALLHVASSGRERTVAAASGRVELRSGELSEGTHRLWFTSSGRASPQTTLRIRFDNAAPAASLREPGRAAALAPGEAVRVAGVVLDGFEVRAEGAPLAIDAQMRFAGEVRVPTTTDALAVRFSHPRRGVHYYLRRVAGR
ncbi:FecR domain-containing protein [Sandaracinus amylolyticus]|uniref:FecR domain-containing protein n=1 Tax=Sandaracinus amylolyticus TaxID=927083 RepID=UPI001F25A2AC|nr:FecR domain-containing protein [Sandaracinus amylolyticus]UJR81191.1 FecR domain-containing protein [Sandaracinus amylolyticus]